MAEQREFNRVLIIGVSGQIGSALAVGLRDAFDVFGTYYKHPVRIAGTTNIPMDTTKSNDILDIINKIRPDAIFYCVGQSDLDFCKSDRQVAEAFNLKAPSLFFKVPTTPFSFFYISSDHVFSGPSLAVGTPPVIAKPPYKDRDPHHPASDFGQIKSQAEGMIIAHNRYTYVLRLGHMYGEGFGAPTSLRMGWLMTAMEAASRGQRKILDNRALRSPIYLGDCVRAVKIVVKRFGPVSPAINIAAPDAMTEYQLAVSAAKSMGIDPSSLLPNCKPDEVATTNFTLTSSLLEELIASKVQSTPDALSELTERLRTGFTKNWP